ncbi:hypothetical protein FRC11_007934, partial [Ceratobasidium sp. 423]
GTAACVAAGRLAAANPDLEILLIEQGPNNFQDPMVMTPALFLHNLAPDSKNAIFWKGNKSEAANGREAIVPSGNDYDDWNAPGWTSKDLVPLLQKIETYHIATGQDTHGYNGPIHISYADYFAQIAKEYLDVCAKRGMPMVEDLMDLHTGHGCGTGRRQDAAHGYIHTQSDNKRLHVVTQTLVTCVLFDSTKAVGVEVIGNKNQDKYADQQPREIRARRLVVMSAGAIGSAIVMQRSGVGEAARLTKLGINVISDLPVGANYEDHSSCIVTYHAADDIETLDPIMAKEPGVMEPYLAQFAGGKGFLTSNANDAGSKIRPTPEELEGIGPAFNKVWKRQFESFPDKERADVEIHVWMYKKSREIARRMPSYRGEYAPLHPGFPEGSAASCVRLSGPPSTNVEDLVYTTEDDVAVEEFVRQRGGTTWHSVATIQMKPKEKGGCVDARLNVYGTENLKVADLSILPVNVGANTYSTALLVGEKAAILIAEDLGLVLP